MRRSKHSLSHYKLATFDPGELVPVGCYEVLPGDSVQQASSALVRCSPLLAPVMHPISVRIHHWYVPYRLLWTGWEDFITGGPDGEGGSSGEFPTIVAPTTTGFAEGSLADYFGIKPGVDGFDVSALPFRAYSRIFNEYYRDQDLVTALPEVVSSGVDATTNLAVAKCAWEKDYISSSRPWPQKGPDVTLPLGTSASIYLDPASDGTTGLVRGATGHALSGAGGLSSSSGGVFESDGGTDRVYDPNGTLLADLTTASAVNVNDVRAAFAIQRYQEARAMYGSRYTEYLRYLGVRSSDARLQRPEYLGGGKQTIAFSEVLQTGPNAEVDPDDQGVATMRGHGIAAMRSRRYRRFFEEHGVVITLMSVRPRTMYADGLHRSWSRRTKEEFWQKELEHIGQQEVLNKEVNVADSEPDAGFGWQDRYAEYRHHPSSIAGDFRDTLNFWHLARLFSGDVTLNADFVTCDPSKRINAVQSEDTLWVMVNHSIQARRMVSKAAVGKIL